MVGDNAGALTTTQLQEGIRSVGTIGGYPVFLSSVLPAWSTSTATGNVKFCIFGNLNRGLAVVERGNTMQTDVSTDAYIKTGASSYFSLFSGGARAFRFSRRAAVGVKQAGAFRVMQTAD